jgi:BASS family bile acid:Na+ symporter
MPSFHSQFSGKPEQILGTRGPKRQIPRSTKPGSTRQPCVHVDTFSINPVLVIRCLTVAALAGLLLAVGLRLSWREVVLALKRCRISWVLAINFVGVPAITLIAGTLFHLERDLMLGMLLLAAAPFAPVVPVFTRMARGDLALAAGLTGVFPFLSAMFTPIVCAVCLKFVPGSEALRFEFLSVLGALAATITLPLAAGVALNHWHPGLARWGLRPVEMLSEVIGALSLVYVTVVELKTVLAIDAKPLLVMVLVFELAFVVGYWSGGAETSRRVIALGTSNRNIALAVLVAISSFPNTPVVGAVVANGLLLILLGLLHVAWWRYGRSPRLRS